MTVSKDNALASKAYSLLESNPLRNRGLSVPSPQVVEAMEKVFDLLKYEPDKNKRRILKDVADRMAGGGLPSFDKVRNQFKNRYNDKALDTAVLFLRDFLDWMGDKFVLHKAVESRVHVLQQAFIDEKVYTVTNEDADQKPRACVVCGDDTDGLDKEIGQVFVVEHDWAAAFANAEDIDRSTEIKLPYEYMTFEFQINKRRVIALTRDVNDIGIELLLNVETPMGWFMLSKMSVDGMEVFSAALALVYSHIKAICISLDAEVTIAEVVRAPHKLNHAREKAGKLPVVDYHVIKLAHRSRVPRLEDPSGEPGTKKRLHFRRGHWRHYEDHKTWIKWMLVGDPDLGFIDKTYRL